MTREDDDWVQVAMLNDAVVVDLLIQIHQAAQPPPPQVKSTSESLPLEWSVRQPRSKPLSVNNNNNKKLLPLSTTSSPTTPLSWSTGLTATATSFSGGGSADGSIEESSRRQQPAPPPPPPPVDASRSKQISGGTRTTSSSKSYKRPRKKKSLGELKEEENLLNKEKRHLKKELAVLRMDIEKLRLINEKLKRQKVENQAVVVVVAPNEMGGNRFPLLPDLNIACGEQDLM
ncbi:uncharacterized protein LOC124913820 isoform X2 [Impatiens glandulifera]|uniref:uncharacterized protein LOC124913820 isoform X2 n=1 Tax=Impatiens glandulifera TaxID=253017 RepID=UPI001FB06780|nr:uncharacterized protein LOC124913820 isoform X2 [Impatiens glandulifera]